MSQPFRLCFPMLPRCRPGNCDPKGRSYPSTPAPQTFTFLSIQRLPAFIENLLPLTSCIYFLPPLPLSSTMPLRCQHRSNLPLYFSWFSQLKFFLPQPGTNLGLEGLRHICLGVETICKKGYTILNIKLSTNVEIIVNQQDSELVCFRSSFPQGNMR